MFAPNSHVQPNKQGSNNDRFLRRSVRSGAGLPNSVFLELYTEKMIKIRINKHEKLLSKKKKGNKMMYKPGDRVRLQNSKSKEWDVLGTILNQRLADDGRIVSYKIKTVAHNVPPQIPATSG